MLAWLAHRLLFAALRDPRVAGRVVVALLGMHPEVAEDLERICHRESRCERAHRGVHVRDAYLGPVSYHGQVKLGHLTPECQPLGDMLWATRGPHGLNAADHWAYMWPCYSPSAFDSPWVSAWVAARKHERKCGAGCDSIRWCPEARRARCGR